MKKYCPQRLTIVAIAVTILPFFAAEAASPAKTAPSGDTVTGHYLEKISGDTLDVKLLPGGKIKFYLSAYYPCANVSLADRPGGPNVGETTATIAIKNNSAVYTTDEYSGHCKISFRFSNNRVMIDQEETSMGCCGYGMNVNASGTYKKISKKAVFQ